MLHTLARLCSTGGGGRGDNIVDDFNTVGQNGSSVSNININMCRSWANSSPRRNICTRVFEIYPMASHDKVRNFHQLSATDPNKKQMNNDEHPSSPKKYFEKCAPQGCLFYLIFLWILQGQHDQAGTLRSFCHSDHVRCLFVPQLAALPDARLNPAFS